MHEQPQQVVIIDRNEERAIALLKAVSNEQCQAVNLTLDKDDQVIVVQQDISGQLKVSSGDTAPQVCRVLLHHLGDQSDEWPRVQADMTVYYGGGGGDDPTRLPSDAKYWIIRPINSAAEALSSSEAQTLLKYAQDVIAGIIRAVRPSFLGLRLALGVKAPPPKLLTPLSILCQTYLETHAAACGQPEPIKLAPPRTPEDVKRITGWHKSAAPNAFEAALMEANTAQWWKDALGAGDLATTAKEEWDALSGASTAAEWEPVRTLLERLRSDATLDADTGAKMVTQAYAAIVRRFAAAKRT